MALLFLDSFDHYATGDLTEKWTAIGTGDVAPTIAAAGRRANSLRWTSGSNFQTIKSLTLTPQTGPGDATVIVGFAYKNSAVATAFSWLNQSRFLSIFNGSTYKCGLVANADGTWTWGTGTIPFTFTSTDPVVSCSTTLYST